MDKLVKHGDKFTSVAFIVTAVSSHPSLPLYRITAVHARYRQVVTNFPIPSLITAVFPLACHSLDVGLGQRSCSEWTIPAGYSVTSYSDELSLAIPAWVDTSRASDSGNVIMRCIIRVVSATLRSTRRRRLSGVECNYDRLKCIDEYKNRMKWNVQPREPLCKFINEVFRYVTNNKNINGLDGLAYTILDIWT